MDKYAVNFIKVDIKRHGTDGTDENFLSKNYYHWISIFNLYFNKRENLLVLIDKEFSDEALKEIIYDNTVPSEYFVQRVK